MAVADGLATNVAKGCASSPSMWAVDPPILRIDAAGNHAGAKMLKVVSVNAYGSPCFYDMSLGPDGTILASGQFLD